MLEAALIAWVVLLAFRACAVHAQTNFTQPRPGQSRVMSFNIRYGSADDRQNMWVKRRSLLFQTIRRHDPDLLGLQEVLDFQADEIMREFPDFTFVGVGRDDGKRKGEFAPVLFRRDRYDLIDQGHFWLSQTPDVPGSIGWDAALTRLATWVKLADRRDHHRAVFVINSHWDHHGQRARNESGRLIAQKISELTDDGASIIVTGDFNSTEDDGGYTAIINSQLVDAYRHLHPARQADERTFHDFKGATLGSRIDFVLVSSHFTPIACTIDRTHENHRYPSDHFPVIATVIRNK